MNRFTTIWSSPGTPYSNSGPPYGNNFELFYFIFKLEKLFVQGTNAFLGAVTVMCDALKSIN